MLGTENRKEKWDERKRKGKEINFFPLFGYTWKIQWKVIRNKFLVWLTYENIEEK